MGDVVLMSSSCMYLSKLSPPTSYHLDFRKLTASVVNDFPMSYFRRVYNVAYLTW